MGALMTAIWPSIEDSAAELLRSYPDKLKQVFSITDLSTVEQYVDVEMLSLIVPLTVAFLAVLTISRATVGAHERRPQHTHLYQPQAPNIQVARNVLVTPEVLAGTLLVAALLTWLGGTVWGTGISLTAMLRGYANAWPLAMSFAGLAMLAAGVVRRPPIVVGIATGTLFLMYLLDVVGKLADQPALRAVSAFRYYGSAVQQGLDVSHVAALTTMALLLCAAGALLFDRRDVR
jgi:ABC-2 type transport system permease protein